MGIVTCPLIGRALRPSRATRMQQDGLRSQKNFLFSPHILRSSCILPLSFSRAPAVLSARVITTH